jgi:hypothetical protein
MKAKYIIVESFGLELPIVFNPIIDHSTVAGNFKVVSAGFCSQSVDCLWNCWGESTSLKLKSRTQDGRILEDLEKDF